LIDDDFVKKKTFWPKLFSINLGTRHITNGLNGNLPTSFNARHSKIYPNWNFWFENIPSGNPAFNPAKHGDNPTTFEFIATTPGL
jgi:hypothetical protein